MLNKHLTNVHNLCHVVFNCVRYTEENSCVIYPCLVLQTGKHVVVKHLGFKQCAVSAHISQVAGKVELMCEKLFLPEGQNGT